MKKINIGTCEIPLDSYVISGTALLGTKGAGKTYAAKGIAEQLLEHEIPIVVFDPIGRWRFLKIAGEDAKKPRGYKLVVAGGEQPDLPLTPQSAPEIVRAAIKENIPLVLDLYDRKLSKADWRRIVQSCFRTLLYENKGLRHIFLEETAEFAPQKVLDGETYSEVEKLVRMGGNASVGITLINQRAQEVNKAVLDLCDNLVLMRQRGAHAIDALEKWIDRLDPASAKAVAAGMPQMKAGEAWVFTGSAESAIHVHTAPIRSFHPDRSKPQLTAAAEASRRTDPADFVAKLSGELEKLMIEAEANDPKMLRKRIADLEAQLRTAGKSDADAAYKSGYDTGRMHGLGAGESQFRALRETALKALRSQVDDIGEIFTQSFSTAIAKAAVLDLPEWVSESAATVTMHPAPGSMRPATRQALEQVGHAIARQVPTRLKPGNNRGQNGAGEKLPRAERALLTVLAQHHRGRTRVQLAVLSGYSIKSSSFANALGALRSAGFATKGEPIRVTDAGIAALGDYEPLPTGRALQNYWLDQLPKAERSLLHACFNAPEPLTKEELAQASGYSVTSSSFANALGRLRSLELVNRGSEIQANEELFR